jgi:hypothetical protein
MLLALLKHKVVKDSIKFVSFYFIVCWSVRLLVTKQHSSQAASARCVEVWARLISVSGTKQELAIMTLHLIGVRRNKRKITRLGQEFLILTNSRNLRIQKTKMRGGVIFRPAFSILCSTETWNSVRKRRQEQNYPPPPPPVPRAARRVWLFTGLQVIPYATVCCCLPV